MPIPAAGAANDGKGTVTAFVHAGDDIDDSSSWLAALSYLHTRRATRPRTPATAISSPATTISASPASSTNGRPGGNPVQHNLVLSGEYFYGHEKGTFNGVPVDLDRSGWYAQGVYQFMPRWSVGLRYAAARARCDSGRRSPARARRFRAHAARETALLEYDTSEFGRLRLQYTHDQSGLKPNDEFLFQYTVIYGPHGAHRY